MRVVRGKALKDKIDTEIDKNTSICGEIERIELSFYEFTAFVGMIEGWARVFMKRPDHLGTDKTAKSGDFLLYKGICIQTHEDYI